MKQNFTTFFEEMSQVLFFRNIYFGIAFLTLSIIFSPHLFGCGLFAALIGYWYEKINRTPKIIKDGGLLSINGFFFGIAMASLFKESTQFYLCLAIGAFAVPLATKAAFEILQHWKLSPYIISYIFVVWVFFLSAKAFSFEFQNHTEFLKNSIFFLDDSYQLNMVFRIILSIFTSMGLLFFLPDPAYGFGLLILISLFSPRMGIFFLLGTALATLAVFFLSVNLPINSDLSQYCYSAGLVGLGLASWPEKFNYKTIFLFCLLSLFLTLAADQMLKNLNLPMLSIPYVMTIWVALLSRVPRLNMSWAQ